MVCVHIKDLSLALLVCQDRVVWVVEPCGGVSLGWDMHCTYSDSWDMHCTCGGLIGSYSDGWDMHCMCGGLLGSYSDGWDMHCTCGGLLGLYSDGWDMHCTCGGGLLGSYSDGWDMHCTCGGVSLGSHSDGWDMHCTSSQEVGPSNQHTGLNGVTTFVAACHRKSLWRRHWQSHWTQAHREFCSVHQLHVVSWSHFMNFTLWVLFISLSSRCELISFHQLHVVLQFLRLASDRHFLTQIQNIATCSVLLCAYPVHIHVSFCWRIRQLMCISHVYSHSSEYKQWRCCVVGSWKMHKEKVKSYARSQSSRFPQRSNMALSLLSIVMLSFLAVATEV